jgi:hypothetical protein
LTTSRAPIDTPPEVTIASARITWSSIACRTLSGSSASVVSR